MLPVFALAFRNAGLKWKQSEDVILFCANSNLLPVKRSGVHLDSAKTQIILMLMVGRHSEYFYEATLSAKAT